MDQETAQVLLVGVVVSLIGGGWWWAHRTIGHAHDVPRSDAVHLEAGRRRFTPEERADAARRAANCPADPQLDGFVELHLENSWYNSPVDVTYYAVYELMMRGICVAYAAQDAAQDLGGPHKEALRPGIGLTLPGAHATGTEFRFAFADAYTYETAVFAPYLAEIQSVDDFNEVVPYRKMHHHHLWVAEAELEEVYELFQELDLRLGVMFHPDQVWWKIEDPDEESPPQFPFNS